ncbi:MAG TPA: amidohydrolase family protein [Actinopolymorphaceae bacterium]|nr:amidohydrolase family protein [Actinopolymorphaceae bacterium]
MSAIDLFDANVLLGPVATDQGADDAPALLAQLDRLRIGSALVTHSHAWRHHPARGNDLVIAETTHQPRLRPCWVILPDTCSEVAPPGDFLRAAAGAYVAAFRACPADHGYDLLGPDMDKLLAGLEGTARRPLLVDLDQVSWSAIDALAGRHPTLPVVVTQTGYRTVRPMAGVLDRRPHVYVDLAYLGTHQVLEWLVARFGERRVLFGTGFPHRDPADAVTRLLWSDLDEQAVAAVGGGTLRALIDGRLPS